MRIRDETGADAGAVRAVLLAAFPTAVEADLVERLRDDGDCEIALVAEDEGRIVGHMLMSRMRVEGGGRTFRALGLAPVAVARKGSGAALAGG